MRLITVCGNCGSANVVQDANVHVNTKEQFLYDDLTCGGCEYDGLTFIEVVAPDDFDTEQGLVEPWGTREESLIGRGFERHAGCPVYTTDAEQLGKVLVWSGDKFVPNVGDTVRINLNGIGAATVVGYASDGGWLGVMTRPHNPPDWWVEQNGAPSDANTGLAFGSELTY